MANHNTKDQAISQFVATQVPYYQNQFAKIGAQSGFAWTFNLAAGILGPIWFAARGLWQWALTFLLIETFAWVQIVRGMFGDLASDAWVRIGQIEGTLDLRRQQLASAIESQSDKIDVYKRTVASLENAIGGIRLEAQALEQTGLWIVVGGVLLMLLTKYTQSVIANSALEKRFSEWLSDSGLAAGLPLARVTTAILFVFTITFATVVHYSFPNSIAVLSEFPTQPEIRLTAIDWVEQFFSFSVSHGEVFFDFIDGSYIGIWCLDYSIKDTTSRDRLSVVVATKEYLNWQHSKDRK